jgi:co-chaperonin GroES (HSP10)
MKNESGLKPLGHAVLVIPYEPKKSESVIVIPDTVEDRQKMVETRAVVIEAGSEAWIEERQPRAKPGDKVLISRFAGMMADGTADGKRYRIVNDRDIYCAIEVE